MNILKLDKTPMLRKDILEKPGILSTKIIFDNLSKNNYKVWMIGHINGGLLYHVNLSKFNDATVVFTDSELAFSYVNKNDIRKSILKNFGKTVLLVGTSILNLQNILDQTKFNYLMSIVINPQLSGSFFVPFPITYVYELVQKKKIEFDIEEDSNFDIVELNYDKDLKRYVKTETQDFNLMNNISD